MADNPLVSVIIPIYKVEPYLCECVDSVINQTYKNLEIILVDDGSPDNCPQICDDYALKDSRIRVIHKPNGGLSDARNAGIEIARGKYISFIDSDDVAHCQMIELLMKPVMEDGSLKMSVCAFEQFLDGNEITTKCEISVGYNRIDFNNFLKEYWSVAWAKVYSIDLFKGMF